MSGAERRVGPEVAVRLEYALFDAEGELVEAPGPEEAIEFIVGVGQAPALIERAIEGLARGESRRVQLAPGDAFGPRDEDAVVVVERGELPPEVALGDEFEAEDEAGETVFLRVVELDDECARLDANHPLAGQRVALELRVLELRVASAREVEAARADVEARHAPAPDVPISRLLKRERPVPPRSE